MSEVTIFHNPDCFTSRNALALIRHAGIEPLVIEFLNTPPSKAELRQLLREKGSLHGELGLADSRWTDDQLLDFIQRHPILVNRPVVWTSLGTKLCRPSEAVLELLLVPKLAPFTKEYGELVEDSGARHA